MKIYLLSFNNTQIPQNFYKIIYTDDNHSTIKQLHSLFYDIKDIHEFEIKQECTNLLKHIDTLFKRYNEHFISVHNIEKFKELLQNIEKIYENIDIISYPIPNDDPFSLTDEQKKKIYEIIKHFVDTTQKDNLFIGEGSLQNLLKYMDDAEKYKIWLDDNSTIFCKRCIGLNTMDFNNAEKLYYVIFDNIGGTLTIEHMNKILNIDAQKPSGECKNISYNVDKNIKVYSNEECFEEVEKNINKSIEINNEDIEQIINENMEKNNQNIENNIEAYSNDNYFEVVENNDNCFKTVSENIINSKYDNIQVNIKKREFVCQNIEKDIDPYDRQIHLQNQPITSNIVLSFNNITEKYCLINGEQMIKDVVNCQYLTEIVELSKFSSNCEDNELYNKTLKFKFDELIRNMPTTQTHFMIINELRHKIQCLNNFFD